MRKQIAQQTISTLLAWLLYCNFNIATTVEHHPENCLHNAADAGKGIEYLSATTTAFTEENFNPGAWIAKTIASLNTRPSYHIKTVVLDAGHGGKDPGCIGASSREKHNALAIVLKLGAFLNEEYPELKVIYTRETDVFVELNERAAIANRNNADLFISVHCNAISVSHVKGTETYVMGLHTAESNLEVAKRENASIYLEDNYQKNYEGYDPNSAEAHIFGSVWQSAYLEQSILFASYVQQYAKELANRDDRGVKQAGFIVLHKTAMPSVLIEAGFLTNRTEERFVASEEGQTQIAYAIFEAFRSYKAKMENSKPSESTKVKLAAKGGTPQPVTTSVKKPAPQPQLANTQQAKPASTNNTFQTQKVPVQANLTNDVYADEIDLPVYNPQAGSAKYRIFLMSWKSRLDKSTGQLSLLTDVEEERSGADFNYYFGKYNNRAEAEKMLPELYNLGFRMAKVVKLQGAKN